jgi:outer membrane protein, adhesin transport system
MPMNTQRFQHLALARPLRSTGLLSLALASGAAVAQPLPLLLPMMQQHPRVVQAQALVRGAQAEVSQAQAASSPRLSGSLGLADSNSAGSVGSRAFSPALKGTVPLYDHGRVKAEVGNREFTRDAQAVRVELEEETLNQQLMNYYVESLVHESALRVLNAQVAKLDELLGKVRSVAALDTGRRYEVSQVDARRAAVLASRDARTIQLRENKEQMRLLLRVPDVTLRPLTDLREQGVLPASLPPLLGLMRDHHPSMRVARLEVSAQEMAVMSASKWNRPRWTLETDLTSERNRDGKYKPLGIVSMRVGSNLDFFDGGAGSSAEKAQLERLMAAQNRVDAQSLELTQSLERLWVLLPLREQRMGVLQRQMDSANVMRQVAFDQFVAGRRPLTDLINFENEYFTVQMQFEELKVQAVATQWQLVAAAGQLTKMSNPLLIKNLINSQ